MKTNLRFNSRRAALRQAVLRLAAVALLGASKAGMTFMPLNWRLAPAELAVILGDSECKLMFVESEFLALAVEALRRAGASGQLAPELREGRQTAHCPSALARSST